jgi:biopolymer transport protein ExbD
MPVHRHHGAEVVVEGESPRPNAEMNITPLIDVLLVLLIIFMATLPLNQRGLDVNLPAETRAQGTPPRDGQIVLAYTREKRLSINKQEVAREDLESRLRAVYENRRDKTMFVMAAGSLRYGDIVAIIDSAKGAGVERVGIVTEGMRGQ